MLLRTLITGTILAAGAFAQMSSFPKPSYFRETFTSPNTRIEMMPPVRLADFVVAGKYFVRNRPRVQTSEYAQVCKIPA